VTPVAEVVFISLLHLIQHPDAYHEQVVRVVGVARIRFEAKALYVSRDDLERAITKNAVWLDVELSDENKQLNGKYVLVEGLFDKDDLGHLKLYSGRITKVERLEEWKGQVRD
jgi:hypothetical protein